MSLDFHRFSSYLHSYAVRFFLLQLLLHGLAFVIAILNFQEQGLIHQFLLSLYIIFLRTFIDYLIFFSEP